MSASRKNWWHCNAGLAAFAFHTAIYGFFGFGEDPEYPGCAEFHPLLGCFDFPAIAIWNVTVHPIAELIWRHAGWTFSSSDSGGIGVFVFGGLQWTLVAWSATRGRTVAQSSIDVCCNCGKELAENETVACSECTRNYSAR